MKITRYFFALFSEKIRFTNYVTIDRGNKDTPAALAESRRKFKEDKDYV